MENDLQKRLFRFSVSVIKEVRNLPNSKEYQVISYQLLKSATAVGANYEEAQGAVSKADFSNKVGIALKEIRETNYWIRILIELSEKENTWKEKEIESKELMSILGSIYSKTSKR
ncbi:MAG: four helix bundle protein [Flavobacteria bacterium RIFCSPLOWO2_12_FULL_35_11]|nr:MAG: four helix bundle protein [Flavobacteria bacterium RIFCSPLOWO2_12_FULL_35_11]